MNIDEQKAKEFREAWAKYLKAHPVKLSETEKALFEKMRQVEYRPIMDLQYGRLS